LLSRGVLNRQDRDFVGGCVDGIIDQVSVLAGYVLAHALDILPPANFREIRQELERFENGTAARM
jgi:hypothetical protein